MISHKEMAALRLRRMQEVRMSTKTACCRGFAAPDAMCAGLVITVLQRRLNNNIVRSTHSPFFSNAGSTNIRMWAYTYSIHLHVGSPPA